MTPRFADLLSDTHLQPDTLPTELCEPVHSHDEYSITSFYRPPLGIFWMRVKYCGPRHKNTCLRRFANNAHPPSLISTFVIAFCKVSYLILLQAKFQFYS